MLWFGLLIGGLLVLTGLATALWAPRVGPNAYFGVRTGYSAANRLVWERSNRVGGLVLAGIGAAMLLVTAVVGLIGVPESAQILVLTAALFALLLPAVAWLFLYTRRLARTTPSDSLTDDSQN